MRKTEYLQEKLIFLLINFVLAFILTIFLYHIKVQVYLILLALLLWFVPITALMILDYAKKNNYYKNLLNNLHNLDKKYLLGELIDEPEFMDGKILYEVITITNRDMHEHIKKSSEMQKEYRDYIESWVHEIKTPIAASRLIIENNKNNATNKLEEELNKVEEYVEQVLYYARSTDANEEKLEITIFAQKKKNNVTLTIEDNGIGIEEKDLKRVFMKGFTGENGRIYGKSTGMGLYICNNIAKKLGLGIEVESGKGVGTKVSIIFPVGDFIDI